MSKVAELAYDIEQLYIDGHSPTMIATLLDCPVEIVYTWMEAESLGEDQTYDPFGTVNS
jgi:hypothetical protein